MEYLINEDGEPFSLTELKIFTDNLDSLSDAGRVTFRNDNALEIAQHSSSKILIVSGPGTGKSTLFKQRINYWLQNNPSGKILALSFVRKLVADLKSDIKGDDNLTDDQKEKVDVFTLHKYARSIVESNHGTTRLRFKPHFRIIDEYWQEMVWNDTTIISGLEGEKDITWKKFQTQLHDSKFDISENWKLLRKTYFAISKYYNATGFSDLIIHARVALNENPTLKNHGYFIIDEFQDFNLAEGKLINELAANAGGLLVVGDDDQVLYEKLKSGRASLIRNIYKDVKFTNAMLPFCSRSSFHIVKTAGHFIQQENDQDCIDKIYLPLSTDQNSQKIQIIGCATPTIVVDYIEKFVEDNKKEIEDRKKELLSEKNKDPFLLILTPSNALRFYAHKGANKKLLELVSKFKEETRKFSEDYYKILNYYSLSKYPENNYTFRKVLGYELKLTEIIFLIKEGLKTGKRICEMSDKNITLIKDKSVEIQNIIDSDVPVDEKIRKISEKVILKDAGALKEDFEKQKLNEESVKSIEHEEEEDAELEELRVSKMSSVELMTIVGSKGLSADHVMIIGFDDVNMSWITRNAFYVALTRARKSLHIISALSSGGANKPHGFLEKLPINNVEFFKYTKSNRKNTPFADRQGFVRYFESVKYFKNKSKK
jgi:superfamily I DNA/RNA helicase